MWLASPGCGRLPPGVVCSWEGSLRRRCTQTLEDTQGCLPGDLSVPATWDTTWQSSEYACSLGSWTIPYCTLESIAGWGLQAQGRGPFCPGLRHTASIKPSGVLTSHPPESLPTVNPTPLPPRNFPVPLTLVKILSSGLSTSLCDCLLPNSI